jgi:hypothetical protein
VNTNLLLPRGINITVRGEYQGGHYMYDGAGLQRRDAVGALAGLLRVLLAAGSRQDARRSGRSTRPAARRPARVPTTSFTRPTFSSCVRCRSACRSRRASFQRVDGILHARRSQHLPLAEQGLPGVRSGDREQRRIRLPRALDPRTRSTTGVVHRDDRVVF